MPDGTPVFLTGGTNPQPSLQWQTANQYNTELTNRWIASQQFSMSGRPGHSPEQQRRSRHVRVGVRAIPESAAVVGARSARRRDRRSSERRRRTTINDDLTLVADARPLFGSNIRVSGLLGGNIYSQDNAAITGTGTSIVIPNYYNLGNFATQTVTGTLTTQRRLLGAYSQVEMDYSDWAFLTFTGRNDWSSTLPTNANSYFYPSAQLAVIFTEAMRWKPSWLDYGKIRLSKAKVGNDAPLYALTTRYNNASAVGRRQRSAADRWTVGHVPVPRHHVVHQQHIAGQSDPQAGNDRRGRGRPRAAHVRRPGARRGLGVSASRATTRSSQCRRPRPPASRAFRVTPATCATRASSCRLAVGRSTRDCSRGTAASTGRKTEAKCSASRRASRRSSCPATRGRKSGSWKDSRTASSGATAGRRTAWPPIRASRMSRRARCSSATTAIRSSRTISATSAPCSRIGQGAPRRSSASAASPSPGLLDIRHGGKLINFETQYETSNGRSILTADRYTWTTWQGVNINTGKPNTKPLFKDQDYYPLIYGTDRAEKQLENAGFAKLREVSAVLPSAGYAVPADESSERRGAT